MRNKRQSGFTLLEVLVAFSMLAVTFATVMQIIAGSAKNTVRATQDTKIAMLAQSKLDELGLLEPIEEGQTNGDFDDVTSWQMEIIPFDVPYEGDYNQDFSAVELMEVKLVIISDIGGRRYETKFETLRAVAPDVHRSR